MARGRPHHSAQSSCCRSNLDNPFEWSGGLHSEVVHEHRDWTMPRKHPQGSAQAETMKLSTTTKKTITAYSGVMGVAVAPSHMRARVGHVTRRETMKCGLSEET